MESLKNLGINIATYRKKSGITQEQLAEQLDVSVSAVSQWETGKTLPDIAAIPVLCHVLDISSDILLGIDHEKEDAEVHGIISEAQKQMDRGHFPKAEKLLLDAHKRYPNRYDIMRWLMQVYFCSSEFLNNPKDLPEKAKQRFQNCIDYARKILDGCLDEQTRIAAKQLLCLSYHQLGKDQKAYEIAKDMPPMAVCQESLFAGLGRDRKKLEYTQNFLFHLVYNLTNTLNYMNGQFDDGTYQYTFDEEITIAQKAIDILHVLFEDKDFGFFHYHLYWTYKHIAKYYGRSKNRDKTLEVLNKAADHAEQFLDFDADKHHTSLVFRGSDYGTFAVWQEENATAELLRELNNEWFDFLREDKDFKKLTKRLEKTAAKRN
ncbi:MAG: helix-turn-helix domain-containing protein [Lachnospiraceae bacterium]|nr:helix-turn-helix domain-containing protein [Lachnospiraceae bacterium]